MNQTFKEIFQEERELSTVLAKHWGYNIKNIGLDNKLKKENDGKIPIVANITTLRMTKDIPKTEKILQIEDELKAIENERLLAKFTEQAAKKQSSSYKYKEEKSPVIILMEQKIKQYNHIVNHKHLNKEYNQQTRRILKIDKDETEKFMEQLHEEENKLKDANLKAQININKYMAKLYKSYRAAIDKTRSKPHKSPSKTKTMLSEPAKSGHNVSKHEQIPKIQKIRHLSKQNSDRKAANSKSDKALLINVQTVQNSMRLTETRVNSHHSSTNYPYFGQLQSKKGNITDRTFNRRQGSRQQQERVLKTIYSPFLQRQKLQQYRKIEKNNISNYATLDMFRAKISQYRLKSLNRNVQKPIKTKKNTTHQYSLSGNPTLREETNHSLMMSEQQKGIYNEIVNQSKHKYNEKRVIFAELLKKKHNKYNKVGLSRVLVKYDQQKEAKELLKGERLKKAIEGPPQNVLRDTHRSKIRSNHLNQAINFGQEFNEIFDNQDENEHYERMCKNEKINLLLKHK